MRLVRSGRHPRLRIEVSLVVTKSSVSQHLELFSRVSVMMEETSSAPQAANSILTIRSAFRKTAFSCLPCRSRQNTLMNFNTVGVHLRSQEWYSA